MAERILLRPDPGYLVTKRNQFLVTVPSGGGS
ncbi:hypothetical protein RCH21_000837 [Arthrobacter sp. PL16]|nr:hypothetical protein [Arthrobacter sp. PL16]